MIGSMIEIYAINSCDTCRKARKWLDESGRDYRCHDLRKDGPDEVVLRGWVEAVGIKRPVFELGDRVLVGFDESVRQAL